MLVLGTLIVPSQDNTSAGGARAGCVPRPAGAWPRLIINNKRISLISISKNKPNTAAARVCVCDAFGAEPALEKQITMGAHYRTPDN